MPVNISINTNTIAVQENINHISVNDPNNPNIVDITQPVTNVVEIITPGPRGPVGPTGSIGPSGSAVLTGGTDSFIPLWVGSTALTSSILSQISGSLQISGSTSITGSLNVSQGITGSLFGTSSFALSSSFAISSSISANTVLQTGITSNATVGGAIQPITFNAGTSLETIIRTMLITYIPSTLTSLVVRSGSTSISTATREVGASFTVNTASFSATADNPNRVYPLSASFTSSGATVGTVQYYFGDNVLGSTNTLSVGSSNTYTRTTSGSITFTVNGKRADTLAAITPATTTIAFQWRNYLGASSTIVTNDATAQTVVDVAASSSLSATKAWTATCTAANKVSTNYTYIMYPQVFGNNLTSIILNGALDVFTSFIRVGVYNVTNTYSVPIPYVVYKSDTPGAYENGVILTIS